MSDKKNGRYHLTAGNLDLDGTVCESYGISYTAKSGEVVNIPDVSPDRDEVDRMVGLFNEMDLDEAHLMDVIEDMLP